MPPKILSGDLWYIFIQGYEVHGIIRRSSNFNTQRIDKLYHDRHSTGVNLVLHYGSRTLPILHLAEHSIIFRIWWRNITNSSILYPTTGDLTDSTCLIAILNEVKPTECYNLAAQVHSWLGNCSIVGMFSPHQILFLSFFLLCRAMWRLVLNLRSTQPTSMDWERCAS